MTSAGGEVTRTAAMCGGRLRRIQREAGGVSVGKRTSLGGMKLTGRGE